MYAMTIKKWIMWGTSTDSLEQPDTKTNTGVMPEIINFTSDNLSGSYEHWKSCNVHDGLLLVIY